MSEYRSRPSQFRLPVWAQQFLAEESVASGTTKTDVVLEALDHYRRGQLEKRLAAGYRDLASANLDDVQEWDNTLMDGLKAEEW
jgi:hypothetical protein